VYYPVAVAFGSAAIDAAADDASSLPELQLDKSGLVPTLCVGEIRLASAWQPEKEAALQMSAIPESAMQVTLFGIGMGYLPTLLLRQLPAAGTLVIVPLNLLLFSKLVSLIDMTGWLSHPCVQIRTADSYDRLPAYSIVTPPMLHFPDRSAEPVRDWLLQKLSEKHVQGFQRSNQQIIDNNIARHLERDPSDEDIGVLIPSRILEPVASEPSLDNCIVIGAGPSLDYCISKILDLQKAGATIIAVDAALVSLLNNSVIPDYVVTIDPLDYVVRLFDVDHERLSDTSLVYFPTANVNVVEAWKHKRYSAIGSHSRFDVFSKQKPSTVLFSSGSVIHPAVDLAVRLGATSVYLSGADFGFPFDKTHAQDSPFTTDRSIVFAEGQTVRNYADDEVPSQINFVSYFTRQLWGSTFTILVILAPEFDTYHASRWRPSRYYQYTTPATWSKIL